MIALLVILVVIGACGALLVADVGQLGYDEAVYATKARSYVTGSPIDWFREFRPPGLAILGTTAGLAGFTDTSVRTVTLVAGLASLALVWLVARQLWGAPAALFALLGAIGAPVVVRELPLFHNDLMSVGLLLLLMWIVWDQLEARSAPTAILVLAAPVAAAAFYVRYGNVGAIVAIGLAVLILWGPHLRAHVPLVGLTLLIGGVLLVPHVWESIALTGSPVGIMISASEVANTTSALAAARQYAAWLPGELLGWVPILLAVAGLVHAVAAASMFALRRTDADDLRRQAWLLLPAVLSGALLIMASHPERRYVMFPVTLLIISGSGAIATGIARLGSAAPDGRGAALSRGLTLSVAAVLLVWAGYRVGSDVNRLASRERPLGWAQAGQRIAQDGSGPCRAVTSVRPILGWYADCTIVDMNAVLADEALDDGTRTYLVFNDLDPERVAPEALDVYRELARDATLLPIADRSRGIEVYRIAP